MNDSKNPPAKTRTLRVDALPRVEGEGALHLVMKDGHVAECRLDIYEPPRFYEAFLRGRDFREVPDITARICGICPVAYQMGSCHALEKAMGVFDAVPPPIRRLRDLFYCGEWIESHVLHMFLLHLPDFLGYESAITLAADHGPTVKRALALKKLGNDLVAVLGGRAVHPVGACVGGFHRVPEPQDLEPLLPRLRAGLEDMCDLTLFLASKIEYPILERDYEFLALAPEDQYPMNLGRIATNKGLNIAQEEFLEVVEERHVSHSTALQTVIKGHGSYLVGPLARLNMSHQHLHPRAAEMLPKVCQAVRQPLPWRNNFLSLPARALETVHALGLAADLVASYLKEPRPEPAAVPITPRAGQGAHGTEAPRGLCWHRYRTAADGTITEACIVPPTAQNQATIEEDLRLLAERLADVPDDQAALRCEHMIRNYDPCISCSVHFLKFDRRQNP